MWVPPKWSLSLWALPTFWSPRRLLGAGLPQVQGGDPGLPQKWVSLSSLPVQTGVFLQVSDFPRWFQPLRAKLGFQREGRGPIVDIPRTSCHLGHRGLYPYVPSSFFLVPSNPFPDIGHTPLTLRSLCLSARPEQMHGFLLSWRWGKPQLQGSPVGMWKKSTFPLHEVSLQENRQFLQGLSCIINCHVIQIPSKFPCPKTGRWPFMLPYCTLSLQRSCFSGVGLPAKWLSSLVSWAHTSLWL